MLRALAKKNSITKPTLHRKKNSAMSQDIFDYLDPEGRQRRGDTALITDQQYKNSKKSLAGDLNKVFQKNQSLTCKISYLNR